MSFGNSTKRSLLAANTIEVIPIALPKTKLTTIDIINAFSKETLLLRTNFN